MLAVVRVGGGEAGSVTLNAIRIIQSADVIVHNDLASSEVLEFCRREARTIQVAGLAANSVEKLLSKLVAEGQRVVRLVS